MTETALVDEMKRKIAIEELHHLEEIIARQDRFQFQLRIALISLLSAGTAAFLGSQHVVPAQAYFSAAVFAILVFWLFSGVYGADEIRAMNRCDKVEKYLSGMTDDYSGPHITSSLSWDNVPKGEIKKCYRTALFNPRSVVSMALLLVLCAIVTIVAQLS